MTDNINEHSEPYNTGFAAHAAGEKLSECPYLADSWDADNWRAGWFAADDAN